MDTVAEMRVLTSNFQAEFGRNSSGAVTVVTKGGSQEFHGSAYANKRHEMFNAKTFFNNYNNVSKSVYRFFVYGYSIGGPLYIPKVLNKDKKKLFFFFSQEYTKQKPATQTGLSDMPTAAQLSGNFFDRCAVNTACTPAYTDGNGTNRNSVLVDPSNGKAPLAGGNLNSLLGTSYYDASSAAYARAMLNFLPSPNLCTAAAGILNGAAISNSNCPSGYFQATNPTWNYNYNYMYSFPEVHPRRADMARIDFNMTSKLNTWARYQNDYDMDQTSGNMALKDSQGNRTPYSEDHPNPGHGWGVGITYTINSTMVNEFTFGKSYNTWDWYAHDLGQVARANMNNPPSFNNFKTDPNFVNDGSLARPTLTPGAQNFDIEVPQIGFGGGQEPNEAGFGSAMRPYTNWNDIYSFNDALSKVQGKHNLKAGVYIERTGKVQQSGTGSYLGNFNFGSGGTPMAADTQEGYANAWLGNMNNYQEGQRMVGDFWFWDVEAFLQDNWRVTRRLTLDLGVRFYAMPPMTNLNTGQNGSAQFYPDHYKAAEQERIYYPACFVTGTTTPLSTAGGACPAANQFAYDPVTGYKTIYSYQGTLVPATVGGYSTTPNAYSGMVVAGTNGVPLGLWTMPKLSPAFRFGFAWDVFGNGKTAVRGGFGQFLNRPDGNINFGAGGQQPVTQNRSIYYTPVTSITNPTFLANAAISPASPGTDYIGNQQNESSYNGSLMVQQSVGFSTVVEVSGVLNLRRHIPSQQPINYQPLFAGYNPSWVSPMSQYLLDPTKNGGLTQGNAGGLNLSNNYFYGPSLCGGCVYGYGGLSRSNFDLSQEYYAFQVSVRRNMTKHLSFGLGYNYSKNMGIVIGNGGSGNFVTESPMFPDKYRNWGPSFLPTPQTLAVNYVYEVPNLGQKLNFKPLGWITDHWTVSGITQWRSDQMTGVPGISFSGTSGTAYPQENWTGSYEGARMLVTGNYKLSSWGFVGGPTTATSQGSPATNGYGLQGTPGNTLINTQAFTIPNPCSLKAASNPVLGVGENMSCFGNAGPGSLINVPGTRVTNFDMTFAKNFPLKSEKRTLMFRAEMYNIFNHANFNGYSIGPTYDWRNWLNGTLVQTNNNLNRMTGTLNPRQMSMSLRVQF
jgi:hypothetical protein